MTHTKCKRTLSLLFTIVIVLSFSANAIAAGGAPIDVSTLDRSDLKGMSTEQLNELIDAIATGDYVTTSRAVTDPVVLAWYAAAEVAYNAGYPLSATLVEYSLDGNDYSEAEGSFATAIKSTSAYRTYFNSLLGGNPNSTIQFNSGDLYYAIHGASIDATAFMGSYMITITDVYDFDLSTNYSRNLFATLVNNWGWLSSQTQVLHVIDVTISLVDGL